MTRKQTVVALVLVSMAPFCAPAQAQETADQAYKTEMRCLAFFDIAEILLKQHNGTDHEIDLADKQVMFYRNALVDDGAKLGKSGDAAIDELEPYTKDRFHAYHVDKALYSQDLEFCWDDWKQRLAARGPDGHGQ